MDNSLEKSNQTNPTKNSFLSDGFVPEVGIEEDLIPLSERYLRERLLDVGRMIALADAKKYDEIAQTCHRIKGVAAPYGFPTLQELAARVESAALARKTNEVPDDLMNMLMYISRYTRPMA